MLSRKERWAARAQQHNAIAGRLRSEADALTAGHNRDIAFSTQPGRIAGRARQNAQAERAHAMRTEAQAREAKAANLQAMAERNAGDAEADRQARRDQLGEVRAGDRVRATLYGELEVVRVNRKSLTLAAASGGTLNVDKAHCRRVA
jgi:hypothetical protein